MSREQTAGLSHTMKVDNSSIGRVEEFKYFGKTLTNQILFRNCGDIFSQQYQSHLYQRPFKLNTMKAPSFLDVPRFPKERLCSGVCSQALSVCRSVKSSFEDKNASVE